MNIPRMKKRFSVIALAMAIVLSVFFVFAGCGNTNNSETANSYTVVFNTDGGTGVPSQRVAAGAKIETPTTPTKQGFTFEGWYTDTSYTVKWNFSSGKVNANTVLYAHWVEDSGSGGNNQGDNNQGGNNQGGNNQGDNNQGGNSQGDNNQGGNNQGDNNQGGNNQGDNNQGGNNQGDNNQGGNNQGGNNQGDNNQGGNNQGDNNQGGNNQGGNNQGDGTRVTVTFNVGLSARKKGLSNPAAVTVNSGSKINAPQINLAGQTLTGWYVENGNTKWNFDSDTVTQTMTLFAKWQTGGGNRVDYTPTLTADDTLYIHYQRADGNYNDWSAWVWASGSGRRKTSAMIDNSGTVIAVDLTELGNPSSINFIIAIIPSSGSWEKDGGDNIVTLSSAMKVGNSYHWFVNSGDVSNGTPYLTAISQSGNVTTEPLRESESDVIRSNAQNLTAEPTATTCDEMGVGYQIFVASFCDSDGDGVGDIRGIIQKLGYLEGLNVDVLWLTPIQSSDSYHGYDCYDYYAIDPKFGTNADYRELVFKAHQRGIKVIMDLVVNHTSTQNEWFIKSKEGVVETVTHQDGSTETVKYRDFYRWKQTSSGGRWRNGGNGWCYYSSFGGSMPELNYDCKAVRNAMADVASYWMAYGLDGFRMDAIKHLFMWDESVNAGSDVEGGVSERNSGYNYNLTKNVEFFKEFNHKLKSKYPNCFLLGEQLSGNVDDVSPFYEGMDSLFDFNTYYNLPNKITGGAASDAANSFNSHARKYNNYRGDRPINSMISSNHDIERLSYKLDTQKSKLYFAVIMTLPGLSWIYYGDEIGLIGHKNNDMGDNGLRQSMKWTSSWANKCTAIPDYSINGNVKSVAEQETDDNSIYKYVQRLTQLRHDNPVLINGKATCSEQDGMLKITVSNSSGSLTVYHNFSSSSKSVSGTPVFGTNTVPAYGTVVVR